MDAKTQRWTTLAAGFLFAASLGVAAAARAEDPKTEAKKQHVKCEVTKDGKTTTHTVKSAEECTQMGGKVVEKKHQKTTK